MSTGIMNAEFDTGFDSAVALSLALGAPKPLPDVSRKSSAVPGRMSITDAGRMSITDALEEAQNELGEHATPLELLASVQEWLRSHLPPMEYAELIKKDSEPEEADTEEDKGKRGDAEEETLTA